MSKIPKKSKNFYYRHKLAVNILIGVLVVFLILLLTNFISNFKKQTFQNSINGFYSTSGLSTQGKLGEVVRSEAVPTKLQNGTAQRILYRTQKADGTYTFSSGLFYTPNKIQPGGSPLFVWAHGTIGLADQCAPSRQEEIGAPWVDAILQRGWPVVATDYAGFGTTGTQGYLIGGSEAHDVLNSVRAAHSLIGSQLNNSYAIWGHSQGGHSALFSASTSGNYMPEYSLVGTAATAPAAQLESLFQQQYKSSASWVIGPYVIDTWPAFYTALDPGQVLTKQGINNYKSQAGKCAAGAALDGIIREKFGQQFFSDSFLTNPSWQQAIAQQTAPVLSPKQPLFVGESLTDQVVLPNTTAQYIQRACSSGSNLTSLWLTDVGHIQLQAVIAPAVLNWVSDRFTGNPTNPTCNQPLPLTPSSY
jgi:pimeloyl-ACP methyl ester carboxylesterase